MTRPGVVDLLADAYRTKSAGSAKLVASRHRWASPAECAAALEVVMDEARANLELLAAARAHVVDLGADPEKARLRALLRLDDGELEELARNGFLDGLGLGES